jgi:uncharacterized membrane protein
MAFISIAAEAAQDIFRRIAAGELEVHGILLRETSGKRFTHILRGLENVGSDAATIAGQSPLAPLQAAMSLQNLLGIMAVAQNAAAAASLKRIEAKLEEIDQRLDGIDKRLERIERTTLLVLDAIRQAPVSRLKAAKNKAINARRSNDTNALISAASNVEQAARDILAQGLHLVRNREGGLPACLLGPNELGDLIQSAAEAMSFASSLHITLGSPDLASRLMHETADSIEGARNTLRMCLSDRELMMRRIEIGMASDAELGQLAARLREDQYWTRGRAILIEEGLFGQSPDLMEFEALATVKSSTFLETPAIGFEPITR